MKKVEGAVLPANMPQDGGAVQSLDGIDPQPEPFQGVSAQHVEIARIAERQTVCRVRPSRVISTSAASRSASWPAIATTRRRSVGTTDSPRRRAAATQV